MKVTIGICAHNERENIYKLLKNLLNQPLNGFELIEIIVVSSGSTDGTNMIVRRMSEKDNRIKLIEEPKRTGKSNAQNIILRNAKGDIIVFISADTLPEIGSLKKLVEKVKDDVGGVDSRALLVNEKRGLVNFASIFTWEIHNETMSFLSESGELRHFAGDMFAIRRGLIKSIPPDIVNDDAYMGLVIGKKGYKILHDTESIVYIRGPATIKDFVHQRERVLFGHRQLIRKINSYPTTFETLVIKRPKDALKIFLRTWRKFPFSDYPKILSAIFLEIAANLVSIIGEIKRKNYVMWQRINSTKKPITSVRSTLEKVSKHER